MTEKLRVHVNKFNKTRDIKTSFKQFKLYLKR